MVIRRSFSTIVKFEEILNSYDLDKYNRKVMYNGFEILASVCLNFLIERERGERILRIHNLVLEIEIWPFL